MSRPPQSRTMCPVLWGTFLALGALPGAPTSAAAQAVVPSVAQAAGQAAGQAGPVEPRRWHVEVIGGWAGLAAGDLNSRVEYDTAVLNYRASEQIQQQHEGGLLRLPRAVPLGGRVLRRLSSHWSVGAGFTFFTTEQQSAATASYSYTVVDPRAQEYQRSYAQTLGIDPLVLTVREYLPHLLVRYDQSLGRRLRIGASLHTGVIVADCEIDRDYVAEGGFYPTSRRTTLEMTGRGGNIAGDAWLSAHLALTSRLGLLVEGGRSWHQVKNVTGTATTTVTTQDGEATEVELTQTYQSGGRWVNQPVTVQSTSSRWQGNVPGVGSQGGPFTLDLSGWQVRLGVSIGL